MNGIADGRALRPAPRQLARHARQPTLQVAHAGLAGIAVDDCRKGLGVPGHAVGIDAVSTQLPRDEKLARDRALFLIEVPGQADDLEAIAERLRDLRQVVRRGDEQHLRQIVVHLEVVTVEGMVWLRIEHFEERAGRIAAVVVAHLVDLVEEHDGIHDLRATHRLHDTSRHRADVRAAVATDLRLIAHAAERHPLELATERPRDGASQRRLADAGRTHEAQDRSLELAGQRQRTDVIEEAVLHFLQAVVIFVQHATGMRDVEDVVRALRPWQGEYPIHEVPRYRVFRVQRRGALQLSQLAHDTSLYRLGQPLLFDLRFQLE